MRNDCWKAEVKFSEDEDLDFKSCLVIQSVFVQAVRISVKVSAAWLWSLRRLEFQKLSLYHAVFSRTLGSALAVSDGVSGQRHKIMLQQVPSVITCANESTLRPPQYGYLSSFRNWAEVLRPLRVL